MNAHSNSAGRTPAISDADMTSDTTATPVDGATDGPASFTRIEAKNCDKNCSPYLKPFKVVPAKCRCRFCPQCSFGIGIAEREKLRRALKGWSAVLMVSLTIDPEQFEGPGDAYDFVKSERCISRLVRELKRRGLCSGRYYYVFEVQKNGNPHWHVLLETKFIPHGIVSDIWNSFGRPKPSESKAVLGFVWLSPNKFKSKEHAGNYVTKYIIKHPEKGWPEWVLARSNVHRFGRSRRLFDWIPTKKNKPESERKKRKEKKKKNNANRIASCASKIVILARSLNVNQKTGTFACRFMANVSATWEEVCELINIPKTERRAYLDDTQLHRLRSAFS